MLDKRATFYQLGFFFFRFFQMLKIIFLDYQLSFSSSLEPLLCYYIILLFQKKCVITFICN